MKKRCIIFCIILVAFGIVFAVFIRNKSGKIPIISEHIEKREMLDNLVFSTKKVENTEDKLIPKAYKSLAKTDNTKDKKDIEKNEIREEVAGSSNIGRIYKYINDPDFDIATFSGIINENNKSCRGEFYAKKNYELLQEQNESPSGDGIKDIVAQFENFIDCSLGIDFPEVKREKIRFFQTEMQLKDKDLARLREDGIIDDTHYFEESSNQYEECLYQIASILTEEEFEALFQFKKTDIQGSFMELLNTTLPEKDMADLSVQ